MAFTTMHFAVGMAGTGAIASIGALLLRRGWRWIPLAMTAGGIWACGPDLPRLFKEDFPSAPFAQTLSARPLQAWLNTHGDWFFFHRMLDDQPKEYALHGLLGILLLYTVSCLALALANRRLQRFARQSRDQDTRSAACASPRASDQTPRKAA